MLGDGNAPARPLPFLAQTKDTRTLSPPRRPMAAEKCAVCGGPLDSGYVTTTNGSGLFWAHDAPAARLRPQGLEVLVGTRFGGTYSASLPASRCSACRTILLQLPTSPKK